MDKENGIAIGNGITVPMSEIEISFIRSSGPGGQHVNKTSTQAELLFDLLASPSIPDPDKRWLASRLTTKLDTAGVLRITAQEHRSQLRNKNAAVEKLQSMLQTALERPKRRKKTRPTRSSVEKRLTSKKKDSDKKKQRREQY